MSVVFRLLYNKRVFSRRCRCQLTEYIYIALSDLVFLLKKLHFHFLVYNVYFEMPGVISPVDILGEEIIVFLVDVIVNVNFY